MIQPRNDRLLWHDHHMLLALITSQRSADPNTQVGACIIGTNNRVLGLGYNGPPKGISPNSIPWEREGKYHETKYAYIQHAEANAIANAKPYDLSGSILYVTMYPCDSCARDIIQAGIKTIYYLSNPYEHTESVIASDFMLTLACIDRYKHAWSNKKIADIAEAITK